MTMNQVNMERFYSRGCEFLGSEYPVMCGAMTWISNAGLVAAVCNSGGFASLAGGNCPPEILRNEIRETRKLTERNFAVNLVTIAPAYRQQLEVVRQEKVPFVIFAGSFPKESEIELVKKQGSKVICFASTQAIAKRMIQFGADALILEGMEAGGHIGHVSLTVLLQQVLFNFKDIPIFAAGGIATGKFAAHMLLMGAAGVQMGTRFAVAEESCAHPEFKKALLHADARDAVSTSQFDTRLPVVAVRALRNEGMKRFGQLQLDLIGLLNENHIVMEEAQAQVEQFWMGALRRAVQDGDVVNGSMMAGQSVGLVDKTESVKAILESLDSEIRAELEKVGRLFQA